MRHSSVIINHRVALPGTSQHRSTFNHVLKYIATRQGVDLEPTEDDRIRYEAEKSLGYIAYRPGAVSEPGADCALFDQRGIADFEKTRRELAANPGAVIQSVVTVRREDAEALGLETKEDFERLLRSEWAKHIGQMDVMRRQDIRWVAAFHTNCPKNWHAHVITWDASGRFDSLISKRKLEAARKDLVYKVMEPARQRISIVKAQARDDLVRAMKAQPLSAEDRRLAREITGSFPKHGSLLYANLERSAPEVIGKVNVLVSKRIRENPVLRLSMEAYSTSVERHADLKGLTGDFRKAYIAAAENDIANRLGNAQIRQIRSMQEPLLVPNPVGATVTALQIAQAISQGTPYRVSAAPRHAPRRERPSRKPSISHDAAKRKKVMGIGT